MVAITGAPKDTWDMEMLLAAGTLLKIATETPRSIAAEKTSSISKNLGLGKPPDLQSSISKDQFDQKALQEKTVIRATYEQNFFKTYDSLKDRTEILLPFFEPLIKRKVDLEPDFDIFSFNVATLYIGIIYASSQYNHDYLVAHNFMVLNFRTGKVAKYLLDCLDSITDQSLIDVIAMNASIRYLNGNRAEKAEKDNKNLEFIRLVCSRGQKPSLGLFFYASIYDDIVMMRQCILDGRFNQAHLARCLPPPISLASSETLESLTKEKLINEEDIQPAQKMLMDYQNCEIEFNKLPRYEQPVNLEAATKEHWALYKTGLENIPLGKQEKTAFLPLESTIVRVDDDKDFYYNANHVLEGTAIAAQAPTIQTQNDFWKMVLKSGTRIIVMLNNFDSTCSKYCDPGMYGSVDVQEKSLVEHEFDEDFITEREMILNGHYKVIHLRVNNWPDVGIIPFQLLIRLLQLIERKMNLFERDRIHHSKILVHCWKGLGRTGTVLTALGAYRKRLKGDKDPDVVFKVAGKLRHERNRAIQTAKQLFLAWLTVNRCT